MINQLRRHLVRLFCICTSSLLILLLAIVMFLNARQLDQENQRNFDTLFFTILGKLQTEDHIADSWLNSMEEEYNLRICIDNNGNFLNQPAQDVESPDLAKLLRSIRKQSQSHGISLTSRPGFASYRKTSTYSLTDTSHHTYLGCGAIMQQDTGYRALYVFMPKTPWLRLPVILIFLAISIIGILLIRILSRILVKKALQSVEEGQKRQQQFIAAASHELRSPLAVIRTTNSYCQSSEDSERRATIEKECVRMSRLVSDLLLLARQDSDTWSVEMKPVNVDTLLASYYDSYCVLAQSHHMPILLHIPEEELPHIVGDKERILQILAILTENAFAHSCTDSPLELSVAYNQHTLTLSLMDHGKGIPDTEKENVFHRFYRADASRHDKEHFGLGLSIARQLAEKQHGTLTLDDTPNGGATFHLSLVIA